MHSTNYLTKEETREGLRNATNIRLTNLLTTLGIPAPATPLRVSGTRISINNSHDAMVYTIWKEIAKVL